MKTYPFQRGEFTVLRKIGDGGMAEVFLAERGGDEGFKTLVAMKRLHAGFALDQYFIRQLVQEGKLLGQMQHSNIVRVHDLRRIEDEYFIVMEYIDGLDLAQVVQVHRDHDMRLPLAVYFHVALALCEALEYAHTARDFDGKPMRLIHRDIKPSNVLLSHRGIVKLTDFGIARVGDASNTGSVVKGTANYMSPEQASGEQTLTPASDIFSLGAVFWEMLTLEKLVDGTNYLNVIHAIKELNVGLKDITRKGIEPGLRMILLRMLARKRDLRYQSMGLVLKDLRFVADQMKVDLAPSSLRDYMSKVTNIARAAAADLADQAAGDEPGPVSGGVETPATPAPGRFSVGPADPSSPTQVASGSGSGASAAQASSSAPANPDAGGSEPNGGFHDDVAALKALIQDPDQSPPPKVPGTPPSEPPPADSVTPEASADPSSMSSAPTARPQAPVPPLSPKAQSPLVRSNANTAGSLAAIDALRADSAGEEPAEHLAAKPSASTPPVVRTPFPADLPAPPPPPSLTDPGFGGGRPVEEVPDDPYFDGTDSDDEYYLRTRRANQIVVAVGVLLGMFVLLLVFMNSDSDKEGDVGADSVVVEEEGGLQPSEVKVDEGSETEDGFGEAAATGDAAAAGAADFGDSGRSDSPGDRAEVAGKARSESGRGSEITTNWSSRGAVARGTEPTSRPQAVGRGSSSQGSESRGVVSSSLVQNRYDEAPESDTEDSSWATAASSPPGSDDEAVAIAGNDAVEVDDGGVMGMDGLPPDLQIRAPRGRLSESEVEALRSIRAESADYNESRALLLAQFDGQSDFGAHCSVAAETVSQAKNRLNPQFNLEYAKCHLRQGRYREALESARLAELHAQEIPSTSRTDRQLKIWEVQAKAFKGLYQVTEDLDYIGDSVAVWERYRHLARSTYRQREATLADESIRGLLILQDGAL